MKLYYKDVPLYCAFGLIIEDSCDLLKEKLYEYM